MRKYIPYIIAPIFILLCIAANWYYDIHTEVKNTVSQYTQHFSEKFSGVLIDSENDCAAEIGDSDY